MSETFVDLPDAMVRDLLACAEPVAEEVRVRMESLRERRAEFRERARENDLICRKADLDIPREPSVAGVDGSYQVHRLTSMDLCAAAAVAVEGTAKEEKRFWQEPYHRIWPKAVPHGTDTTSVLRGIMVSMELELAALAPHDLVLLDGSFASLIIYLNQGLSSIPKVPPALGSEMLRRWQEHQVGDGLLRLLHSERIVAVPKYTSRNEIVSSGLIVGAEGVDGRTLATLILEPGEYTRPLPIYAGAGAADEEVFHLPDVHFARRDDLNAALHAVGVTYYRPYGWVPALRLELPGPVCNSRTRLSMVLDGISRQFFSPAVVEPYPLFLADRMVKSLGAGVAIIEQTVAQHVADNGVDVELTMLCLQNYRTEGGRGGV